MNNLQYEIAKKSLENDGFNGNDFYETLSDVDFYDYDNSLAELYEMKIIKKMYGNHFKATPFAKKLLSNNELEKYIKNQGSKEFRKHSKELYDYQISRFQSKTRFLPLIFSFLSLIISIIAIALSVNNKEEIFEKKIIREQTKVSIPAYNNIRKNDSLPSSIP